MQLILGVEEACKHARSVLFVLTTTSAFVLVAALSETTTGSIKLPVAGNDIPRDQFFTWSPLVVLTIYLYLQVYVQEIMRRLERLHTFEQSAITLRTRLADLLFPWIFVIGLESQRMRKGSVTSSIASSDQLGREGPYSRLPMPWLYGLAAFIVWILGPLVLGVLWFVFLRAERSIAIVPCAALLIASWMTLRFLRPNRLRFESPVWGLAGILLVLITLASVPHLREQTYLSTLWGLRQPIARFITDFALPVAGRLLPFVLAALMVGALAKRFYAQLFPTQAYRRRIKRSLDDLSSKDFFIPLRAVRKSEPKIEADAVTLLLKMRSAIITGPPGSGKSTLLRNLGVRLLKTNSDVIPIFFRLSQAANDPNGLAGAAARVLREYGVHDPTPFLMEHASRGHISFLLDGLDEVSSDRTKIVDELREFLARFPACRSYITSRPNYEQELEAIVEDVVEIRPLRQTDISNVLRQQFGLSAPKVEGRLAEAGLSAEIMTNPLLLNLTSQIINQIRVAPTSKASLIERSIDLSLSGWDRARNIQLSFTAGQKRSLLKRIAAIMRNKGSFEITWDEGLDLARDTLGEPARAANAKALLLETLRSGLLIRRGHGRLAFAHHIIFDHLVDATQ